VPIGADVMGELLRAARWQWPRWLADRALVVLTCDGRMSAPATLALLRLASRDARPHLVIRGATSDCSVRLDSSGSRRPFMRAMRARRTRRAIPRRWRSAPGGPPKPAATATRAARPRGGPSCWRPAPTAKPGRGPPSRTRSSARAGRSRRGQRWRQALRRRHTLRPRPAPPCARSRKTARRRRATTRRSRAHRRLPARPRGLPGDRRRGDGARPTPGPAARAPRLDRNGVRGGGGWTAPPGVSPGPRRRRRADSRADDGQRPRDASRGSRPRVRGGMARSLRWLDHRRPLVPLVYRVGGPARRCGCADGRRGGGRGADGTRRVRARARGGGVAGDSGPRGGERGDATAARRPAPRGAIAVSGAHRGRERVSGKELVARAIHRASPRRDRRFSALNCAALSDELAEAELFGHAKGAFTGAVAERAGLFEDANGGTLFLDEVSELSARVQAKLLRVLQEHEVRRLGEAHVRRVDARIVAASNRPLAGEVEAGRFRRDLRYRLDVVRLTIPAAARAARRRALAGAHMCGRGSARRPAAAPCCRRPRWPRSVATTGRAMSANCRTCSPRSSSRARREACCP
jgi:hypothetical protein